MIHTDIVIAFELEIASSLCNLCDATVWYGPYLNCVNIFKWIWDRVCCLSASTNIHLHNRKKIPFQKVIESLEVVFFAICLHQYKAHWKVSTHYICSHVENEKKIHRQYLWMFGFQSQLKRDVWKEIEIQRQKSERQTAITPHILNTLEMQIICWNSNNECKQ